MLSDATGAESDARSDALHQITPSPPLHQTLHQTPQITPRFPVLHQTLHQTPHQTLHQIASDGCIRFETPCFNPGTTRRTLLNGANPNWSTVREGDECTLKPLHQTPTGCCCIRCCIKWCAVGLLLRLHQMLHQMCVVRRPAFASNENLMLASNYGSSHWALAPRAGVVA